MTTHSLQDLYVDELRDLYDAEQQILKALPSMASAASSPALKRAFHDHLEQTRVQAERLELIFKELGQPTRGKHCQGMEGLIKEGNERLREDAPGDVRDAALISAAQRVEHYEMAGYGTARTFAQRLEAWDQADLLQQSLDEESEADYRLTDVAESGINQAAERGSAAISRGRLGRLKYVDADDLPQTEFNYGALKVRNHGGDDLGALDGFIVEQATGRPVYYVVDSGGWFIGRRYLIPIGKARFDTATRVLVADLDRDTLQRYPEFNTNAFLAMTDEQARAYERRLLATINPRAVREPRYWESYERLPEYAQPSWLSATSWEVTGREPVRTARDTRTPADPGVPSLPPDRELIRANEEYGTVVEPQQSHPSEGVRGIVEEAPRRERNKKGR